MGILDRFRKPDVKRLKNNQDIDGLIKALDHKNVSIRAASLKALKSIKSENARGALKAYEELRHTEASTYTQQGISLIQELKYKQALRCFEHALESEPTLVDAWLWKSRAQDVLGNFKSGLNSVEEVLKLDPNHIQALKDKARLLAKSSEDHQRLECYEKLLALEASDSEAWLGKGETLSHLGRHDEAITCCETAIDLAPDAAITWYKAGGIYEDAGAIDDAIRAYRRFLSLAPKSISESAESKAAQMVGSVTQVMASYIEGRMPELEAYRASKPTAQQFKTIGPVTAGAAEGYMAPQGQAGEQQLRINRVEICFSSQTTLKNEQEVIDQLIRQLGLDAYFTPDVHISSSYGSVPGIDKSVFDSGNISEESMVFAIARAFVIGMTKSEVQEAIVSAFYTQGLAGLLIAGSVKKPWANKTNHTGT